MFSVRPYEMVVRKETAAAPAPGSEEHSVPPLLDGSHRRIIDTQGVAGEEVWAEFSPNSPLKKSGFELALQPHPFSVCLKSGDRHSAAERLRSC